MTLDTKIGSPNSDGVTAMVVSPISKWVVVADQAIMIVADNSGNRVVQAYTTFASRLVDVHSGTTLLLAVDYDIAGAITDVEVQVFGFDVSSSPTNTGYPDVSAFALPDADDNYERTILTAAATDTKLTSGNILRTNDFAEFDLKGHAQFAVAIKTAFATATSITYAAIVGRVI